MHGAGPVHIGDRYGRWQRRHQLGQGVCYGLDNAETGSNRIIAGRDVVIPITRIEPDFVATANAVYSN